MSLKVFISHSAKPKTATPRRGGHARAAAFALLTAAMLAPLGSMRAQNESKPGAKADWLLKYKLDPKDPNIDNEDPDGDGFTNLEEYLAGTDPTDKNSHPPYATKLFLETTAHVAVMIVFDGRPDDRSYEIGTPDIQHPTQILEMGDLIAGTKYKIVRFVEKHKKDAGGIDTDVSELTIQNIETGDKVVLSMEPTIGQLYAVFKYFWKKPVEIKARKGATFTLDPETDVDYTLIDFNDTAATIRNLKTNEVITIPLLKGNETFHLLK